MWKTHKNYFSFLLLRRNNGYANAPQCWVTCTYPILLLAAGSRPSWRQFVNKAGCQLRCNLCSWGSYSLFCPLDTKYSPSVATCLLHLPLHYNTHLLEKISPDIRFMYLSPKEFFLHFEDILQNLCVIFHNNTFICTTLYFSASNNIHVFFCKPCTRI